MTESPNPPALDARTGAPIPIDRTAYHVILGDGLAQWCLDCDNAVRLARQLLDNVDAIDNIKRRPTVQP